MILFPLFTPLLLAQETNALAARIEPAVREFLVRADAPSAGVCVVHDAEFVYTGAFGQRHRGRAEVATLDTLFGVGSVSKIFTATLAVLLDEEGELDLEELVADWLPQGAAMPGAEEITLRHLLSHTSGLPRSSPTRRNLEIEGPLNPGIALPMSHADLLEGLRRSELEHPPGEVWSYSNFGMNVAGYVLERITERAYEDLLRERVLQPLGMEDSVIHRSEADERRYAAHYWTIDPERIERPAWVFGQVAAAGGLTCTIEDLGRFLRYHGGSGEALDPSIRDRMREPVIEAPIGRGGAQCLGWFRKTIAAPEGARTVFEHGGEIDGHSAHVLCMPSHRLGLAVTVNLGGSAAPDLARALLPFVLGRGG